MNKLIWSAVGALFALAMFTATSFAQQTVTRTISGEPGKLWMLGELNAVIVTKGDTTKVEAVAPAEHRLAAYKAVDLKERDIIVMANGKKIAQASDLEKLYETLKVGEELKLGIKRGTDMKLVAIVKADSKDLPKRRMMMAEGDGQKVVEREGGPGEVRRQIKIPEGATNPTPLMAAGFLIADKAGKVIVIDVMPHGARMYDKDALKSEDIITAFHGQPVKSSAEVASLLDKAKVGDKISMTVLRAGKESTVTFAKSEAEGNLIIK